MKAQRVAGSIVLVLYLALFLPACASHGVKRLEGAYYWTVEVEAFVPCTSQESFWIVGGEAILSPVRKRVQSLRAARRRSEAPLFVEIFAVDKGKATDGFAMDYDSVYEVRKIKVIADTLPPGCQREGNSQDGR